MKFALSALADRYTLPGRPTPDLPSAVEARKQTQFLLGEDLALFERAMNLQLAVVGENKKAREPATAALLSLSSRVFSCLADACTLMSAGSYASCPPLLRTALDCIAAERSLIAEGFQEYEAWYETAVEQAREQQALALALGRYRAGSVLAEDERLGRLYRLLTDLSMPHFGSTSLQVAPDTNLQKITMAFGDSAFHLGWAELVSSWMLLLVDAQLETLLRQDALAVSESARSAIASVRSETGLMLKSPRRCRVEEVNGRWLFHNFRRTASGQPRRVLL